MRRRWESAWLNSMAGWITAACMGYCLMAMQQAGVPETMRRKVLACLEEKFDFYSLEDAEKAGYANTEG